MDARRRVWLFDLDNTLHDAFPQVFPHISRSMTAYLREHLGLDERGANALRVDYWRRYGATLLGLMRHHGTDPRHFLWHTHQFPQLARMLVAERGLGAALRRLAGRKVLFSNAPEHYARAVLRELGIAGLFDDVFAIEHMKYRPKPSVHAYRRVLRRHRLDPRRCVLVEDTRDNLRPARRLGMKTVWVGPRAKAPAGVDLSVRSVLQLPRRQHLI